MDLFRKIKQGIDIQLTKYPIVVVTGPRQSGKTTLLRNELKDYRYITLENLDNREYATNDTKGFLEEYDDKVIFDEVQNVPKLFSYLQGIVDKNKVMGQFILSGSQNFNLMENITQSLAGRVALFELFPFDFQELKKAKLLENNITKVMTTGFYPAIFDRDINPDRYYADYIKTYIQRDVTQLVNIQNQTKFKRFLKLCATRCGQLLNLSNLASDAGISHTTAANWISLLETSYIVFQLPPFYKNYSKRLIKSPKLYFYDTGLLCHLLDIRNGDISPINHQWGNIFENMIVSELVKQNKHQNLHKELYYWRDSHGNEVDLLIPNEVQESIIEIKSSGTIGTKMFKGLDFYKKLAGKAVRGQTLIYGGKNDQNRTKYNIIAWYNIDLGSI